MTEGDGEELYFELDAAETTGAIRLLLMAAEQPAVEEASPQPEERREETGVVGDLMAGMLGEVAVAIEGEARGGPRAVIAARRRQREQEEREALESPAKGGGEGSGSEGHTASQPAAASAASTPPANRAATPPEPEPEPEPAPTEPRSPESGGGARARARGLQPASPEALQATSSR